MFNTMNCLKLAKNNSSMFLPGPYTVPCFTISHTLISAVVKPAGPLQVASGLKGEAVIHSHGLLWPWHESDSTNAEDCNPADLAGLAC